MLRMPLDWHADTGRWSAMLPLLLAGDDCVPSPVPRFVTRLLCEHCETHYLTDTPAAQVCPHCGRTLLYVATWDLRLEAAPRWWRAVEGIAIWLG